jgi:hypothetical protein
MVRECTAPPKIDFALAEKFLALSEEKTEIKH